MNSANAAGKKLYLTDLSEELRYNKPELLNPHFIVSRQNGKLFLNLNSKSFIFAYKLDNMVTTIKKGTSREKIIDALSKRKVKIKGPDLQAFCGSISLKEDPLDLQKKWRNEWE